MLPAVGYRERFIDLLAASEVVRFGDFTLKSGRKSPYFIDAGQLRTGRAIAELGRAYAERILDAGLEPEVVFGPAYKGVPLAVSTAMALAQRGRDAGFAFDRKEAKDHGEGGTIVGTQPVDGQKVVIVDDVITSGASIEHSVSCLRGCADVAIVGGVVAVDREERGRERSTLVELEESLGIPILAVVTIRQILERLSREGGPITAEERARVEEYLGAHRAG
jgi:orotate phosphoribosyltransferase